MKALILEDEQIACKRLIRMLNEVASDVEVVATFESLEDTKAYLDRNTDIDLLFLDIHVADGNSFELFNLSDIKARVIFTTAYDKYAIDAFRNNATDYLLKPLKKDQLAEAIGKVSKLIYKDHPRIDEDYRSRIIINFMSKIHSLRISDIAYIYSKNKISYFYLKNGEKYPSDYKLQELEVLLNPKFFYRANRQFIIHIDAIAQIVKHQASRLKIMLQPPMDVDLIISTDKTPFFKKWLER